MTQCHLQSCITTLACLCLSGCSESNFDLGSLPVAEHGWNVSGGGRTNIEQRSSGEPFFVNGEPVEGLANLKRAMAESFASVDGPYCRLFFRLPGSADANLASYIIRESSSLSDKPVGTFFEILSSQKTVQEETQPLRTSIFIFGENFVIPEEAPEEVYDVASLTIRENDFMLSFWGNEEKRLRAISTVHEQLEVFSVAADLTDSVPVIQVRIEEAVSVQRLISTFDFMEGYDIKFSFIE